MIYCEIPAVNGTPEHPKRCTGHLGKFDDCLVQALWELSLEGYDDAGRSDFEGHVALVVVTEPEPCDIEGQGDRRIIAPVGNYLIWSSSSGRVTLSTVDTIEGAREILEQVGTRLAAWEMGCDPDKPGEHIRCADYDACQMTAYV